MTKGSKKQQRCAAEATGHLIALTAIGFKCSCGVSVPDLTVPDRMVKAARSSSTHTIDGLDELAVSDFKSLLSRMGDRPTKRAVRHQFEALLLGAARGGAATVVINCLCCDRESTFLTGDRMAVDFAAWLRARCGSCGVKPIDVATREEGKQ